jgi:hypothetical protein
MVRRITSRPEAPAASASGRPRVRASPESPTPARAPASPASAPTFRDEAATVLERTFNLGDGPATR